MCYSFFALTSVSVLCGSGIFRNFLFRGFFFLPSFFLSPHFYAFSFLCVYYSIVFFLFRLRRRKQSTFFSFLYPKSAFFFSLFNSCRSLLRLCFFFFFIFLVIFTDSSLFWISSVVVCLSLLLATSCGPGLHHYMERVPKAAAISSASDKDPKIQQQVANQR